MLVMSDIMEREILQIKKVFMYSPSKVAEYWNDLINADKLKYRMSDVVSPKMPEVMSMIRRSGDHMYMVSREKKCTIVAEFMLEGFTGRSAQVHFSMHPDNSLPDNTTIVKSTLRSILSKWRHPDDRSQPYLDSLFGLTPVHNRRACIFVLRAGMKKMGTIKSACSYMGHICDGMLSTVTRESMYGLDR
jgi:hypothetical protein